MHNIWELKIYDQDGNVVASAEQKPNEASNIHGDMILLAESLPSIKGLSRFFTDPDDHAAAAYTAYADGWENTYGSTLPTWNELKAMPQKHALVTIWQGVGEAASKVDPSLN